MKLSKISVTKDQLTFFGVLKIIFRSVFIHYKFLFLVILISGALAGIFQILIPKILQQIIDSLIQGIQDYSYYFKFALFGGGALLLAVLFKHISDKLSFYVATQVEDRWKYTSLLHFYNLPLSWQDLHDSGEIGSRIDRGGSAIFSILHEVFGHNLLVSFLTLLIILGYTLFAFPTFFLLFVIPLPL